MPQLDKQGKGRPQKMLIPMVQQAISKYQNENKTWNQSLYSGPQVLLLDGPINSDVMLKIANSVSRMLQYNYPGTEVAVINAAKSPGVDFVSYRVLSNCKHGMITIIAGADIQVLQDKLKEHGFHGKMKTVLLYENLENFFNGNVNSKKDTSAEEVYDFINNYSKYFSITRTMRYSTLFAHSVSALERIDEEYFKSTLILSAANQESYFIDRVRKLISSVTNKSFCQWVYFSPKQKYTFSLNIEKRTVDSIANEILTRVSNPSGYMPFQFFGSVDLPNLSS